MSRLFSPDFAYPCDHVGAYIELDGTIVNVHKPLGDCVGLDVETKEGCFTGYWHAPDHTPEVGFQATVRVYHAGGGFYPDNRIVRWGRE